MTNGGTEIAIWRIPGNSEKRTSDTLEKLAAPNNRIYNNQLPPEDHPKQRRQAVGREMVTQHPWKE